MSKLIQRAGFFLIGLFISTYGFSAQTIKVSDGQGGVGIVGPKGETFLFYGEGNSQVSIKKCVTNRTVFETGRGDCIQKKGTFIDTLSQADFVSHLKLILTVGSFGNYDNWTKRKIELWRRPSLPNEKVDPFKERRDEIKVALAQIKKVRLAYGQSANIEEHQTLVVELAEIMSELEFYDGVDTINQEMNQLIAGLLASIMSTEDLTVYSSAKDKKAFEFNILRGVIQIPIVASINHLIRVEPVSFLMGSPSDERGRKKDEFQHLVILRQAFEMQPTEETQLWWVSVMGYNPSRFQKKEHCPDTHIEREIGSNKVSLCPFHPVESVTWWSGIVYANRLSEMRGLVPAYDLSDMDFAGKAEEGTLTAIRGELRINTRGGKNIYHTEGFRFPTEAEWEYAARAGTSTPFSFGETISSDLANYSNDPGQTVSVMSLRSANKLGFSHMHGNVWEWVHDWYNRDYGGPEWSPRGPWGGFHRVMRGGSFAHFPLRADSSVAGLRSANRGRSLPDSSYDNTGLRLVRTVQ